MLLPLTKRQKQILDYIHVYCEENSYAPTLDEIKKNFSLRSISTVHEHIENLKRKGYLKKSLNQARGLKDLSAKEIDGDTFGVPIIGTLPYSNNSYSDEANITVHSSVVKDCKELFALKVTDDSYDLGDIRKGDVLVFSKDNDYENDNVILCRTGSNSTPILKVYKETKLKIKLEPLSSHLKSRVAKKIEFIGKLVCLVRCY